MDPSPSVVRFIPDRRYTAIAGAGCAAAVTAAALTDAAAGHLLYTLAAVLLLGYVCADLVFSPRLTASETGIVINAPLTRASLSWDQVSEIRADTRFRRGLRSTTLEIDAGTVLAVFSKRALGADPAAAAARIEALRPR